MRSRYIVQETQQSLFRMRVSRGVLLKDVPLKDLTPDYRAELVADARHLHLKTNLALRRVRRGGRKVWRFIDKDLT